MSEKWSLEDGKELIKFARNNIENFLKEGNKLEINKELKTKYGKKGGAFVTLNKIASNSDNSLRGCIGIILPHYPLIETIGIVSISAAVEDPRFPEVKLIEMEDILVEISILSIPEKIKVDKPEEYLNEIVIGRDGLIITCGNRRGLLLPQVPVEHNRNWDSKTFLEHTCEKAWIPKDSWKNMNTTIVERFTATIFEEKSPKGEIRQKKIGE